MAEIKDSDRRLAEEFVSRKYAEALGDFFRIFARIGEVYDPNATLGDNRYSQGSYGRKRFGER